MTKLQQEKYRQALLSLGRRLRGHMADVQHEALRGGGAAASGNLSNVPTHPADHATDTFEQESAVSILENQEQILEQTGDALQRLDDGIFGKCQECGQEVNRERLDAVPYTPYCVACARVLQGEVHA